MEKKKVRSRYKEAERKYDCIRQKDRYLKRCKDGQKVREKKKKIFSKRGRERVI